LTGTTPGASNEIDIADIEAVRAEMARRDAAKRVLTSPGTALHGFAQARWLGSMGYNEVLD